jgi:AraC-like DNA-binding protein
MGKPIKQVAQESGFSDYYYFLQVLKRAHGITPKGFQTSHRPQ